MVHFGNSMHWGAIITNNNWISIKIFVVRRALEHVYNVADFDLLYVTVQPVVRDIQNVVSNPPDRIRVEADMLPRLFHVESITDR